MSRAVPLPADERRTMIVDATRPLLVAHGAAFTTRQVAEAAGIAEGTIFRVFDSKQDLLDAVIDDVLDPAPVVRVLQELSDDPDLEHRISRIIATLHGSITGVAEVFAALHAMPSPDVHPHPRPHKGSHGRNGRGSRSAELQKALECCLAPWAGELRTDLAQAAAMVRSLSLASYHPLFGAAIDIDPADIADILVHGLEKDS